LESVKQQNATLETKLSDSQNQVQSQIIFLESVKQQNETLQTKLSDSQNRVRELEETLSKIHGVKITIYEGWVIDAIQIGSGRAIGGIGGDKKSFDAVFRKVRTYVENLTINDFFVLRASYHFKLWEYKKLRGFDFFNY